VPVLALGGSGQSMNKRTLAQAAKVAATASALHGAGRWLEAEQYYAQALALVPDDPDVLDRLATVRAEQGKHELALEALARLQQLRPNDPLVSFRLGRDLLRFDRTKEALAALERAVRLKPNLAEVHYWLGVTWARLGNRDAAIAAYASALRIAPDSTDALVRLCDEYLIRGDWDAALDAAEATVSRHPNHANALYVKGGLLGLIGKLDQAEQVTREALRLDPRHAGAYGNLGAISSWRQDHAQAVSDFRRALSLRPDIPEARLGLAHALLAQGNFAEGWPQHERSRPLGVLTYRKNEPVLWDGRVMRDGVLTLFGEGGLGDVLQFCRLAVLARERVGKVVLYLQPYYAPLSGLLGTLEGIDEITLDAASLRTSDASLSVFSLPYVFAASLEHTPVPVPYLRANAALCAQWQQRLREDFLPRVGLVWGGKPLLAHAYLTVLDRRRSIPLSELAPVLVVPGVSFYCLQKGAAANQLADSPLASRMIDYTADIADFDDTAALISQLDLVVTVDTSVAHLAGALGTPAWMLNRYDSCWRWGPHREDAPWYPTLRIFRQPAFGEWAPVVDRVAKELRAWATALSALGRKHP
jgi:tetratricopeptide (TPR) repeat protein